MKTNKRIPGHSRRSRFITCGVQNFPEEYRNKLIEIAKRISNRVVLSMKEKCYIFRGGDRLNSGKEIEKMRPEGVDQVEWERTKSMGYLMKINRMDKKYRRYRENFESPETDSDD